MCKHIYTYMCIYICMYVNICKNVYTCIHLYMYLYCWLDYLNYTWANSGCRAPTKGTESIELALCCQCCFALDLFCTMEAGNAQRRHRGSSKQKLSKTTTHEQESGAYWTSDREIPRVKCRRLLAEANKL